MSHEHPDGTRVGERVEPATPDELADLAVHDVQSGRHGTPVEPGRSVGESSGLYENRAVPRVLVRPSVENPTPCGGHNNRFG